MVATKAQKSKPLPPPKVAGKRDLPINAEYEDKAKAKIREAIAAQGSSYAGLAAKLREMGVEITDRGLENKISRGGFSAAFYLQCLDALGVPPQ